MLFCEIGVWGRVQAGNKLGMSSFLAKNELHNNCQLYLVPRRERIFSQAEPISKWQSLWTSFLARNELVSSLFPAWLKIRPKGILNAPGNCYKWVFFVCSSVNIVQTSLKIRFFQTNINFFELTTVSKLRSQNELKQYIV